MDRSMLIQMEVIPDDKRRSESEILAEFNAVKGKILGALLNIAAAALQNLPQITLERMPRMADFARFAVACEESIGLQNGTVINLLLNSRNEIMADRLNEDPFGMAVYQEAQLFRGMRTVNDWYKHLSGKFSEESKRGGWPKGPRALSESLGRISPLLRNFGVEVERNIRKQGCKFIRIGMTDINRSQQEEDTMEQ